MEYNYREELNSHSTPLGFDVQLQDIILAIIGFGLILSSFCLCTIAYVKNSLRPKYEAIEIKPFKQ